MQRHRTAAALFATVSVLAVGLSACGGPAFVRDTDMPSVDEYALSTGLDKKDLERLFGQNEKSLMSSGAMNRWKDQSRDGKDPTVAIFPVRNETSEHVDSQLQALLAKFETQLVNSGYVAVISHENQKKLLDEIKRQQGPEFDPAKATQLGKQYGVQYFITGKVYDAAEKTRDGRRVQYFLFMQCIEVETGIIRWQNEANLTKALVK